MSVNSQSKFSTRISRFHRVICAAVLLLVLSPAAHAAVKALFVASANENGLSRIDGTTGSHVYDNNTLGTLYDLTFGPDGNAYVSAWGNNVVRVNPATGASMGTFASDDALDGALGMDFGPDLARADLVRVCGSGAR